MLADVRKELDAAVSASSYTVQGTPLQTGEVEAWAARTSRRERVAVAVPNPERDALAAALSAPLHAFTSPDTGTIGFALHDFMVGASPTVTVEQFAEDLVRSAAVFGPAHILSVIERWMTGEPAEYTHVRVLRGVSIPEPVEFGEGVWFEELPDTGEGLEQRVASGFLPLWDLLGAPVMFSRMRVGTVFYRPDASDQDRFGRLGVRDPDLVGPKLETEGKSADLLSALSLICGSCVQVAYEWDEYSDEMVALRGPGARVSQTHNLPRFATTPGLDDGGALTPAHLADARYMLERMSDRRDLDIAIERWKNSMSALDEANRVIDLRTVLESLYCQGERSELKLRTTLRATLHLAPTPADRKDYYVKLRALYDLGSRVVHGGGLPNNEHVRELVAWSYSELRRAILKRLEEGPEMDWDALMLGLVEPIP